MPSLSLSLSCSLGLGLGRLNPRTVKRAACSMQWAAVPTERARSLKNILDCRFVLTTAGEGHSEEQLYFSVPKSAQVSK